MRGEREYISIRIIIPFQQVKGFSQKKWGKLDREEEQKLAQTLRDYIVFGFGRGNIAHVDVKPCAVRKVEKYILDTIGSGFEIDTGREKKKPAKLKFAIQEREEVVGVVLKALKEKSEEAPILPGRSLFEKEAVNEKEEATEAEES